MDAVVNKLINKCERKISSHLGFEVKLQIIDNYENNINKVVSVVSRILNVPVAEIYSKKGYSEIVEARHISMYILFQFYRIGKSAIARKFNVNHATVYSAIKKIQGLIDVKDTITERNYNNIKKALEL